MSEDWWSRWFRRRWPFFRGFGEIDDLFREMEDFMEREFRALSQRAPRRLMRERRLPDGRTVKEWGPFVYGYSVTIGPDGKPHIREFGNVKPGTHMGRPSINVKDQREPLVDTVETNDDVRVIAELPGVEKNDITLHATEKILTISVDTPLRKFYKDVTLPTVIDTKQAKSSYKNGVLEVVLKKRREEKSKGERINIE